jgi:hypothetical protein
MMKITSELIVKLMAFTLMNYRLPTIKIEVFTEEKTS